MVTYNAQRMLHRNQDPQDMEIIAILKPGKDSAIPKNYIPIYLVYHTYKLYERMILNRIAPVVEQRLIKVQAGFRTRKVMHHSTVEPDPTH